MTVSLDDLQAYLTNEGSFTDVLISRMPTEPDACITLTAVGGSPPLYDGAFEPSHIQVRTRANSDEDAATTAKAVHSFLSAHEGSFTMGGTYVLTIMPISGPPLYFGRDVVNRTIYNATYEFTCPV